MHLRHVVVVVVKFLVAQVFSSGIMLLLSIIQIFVLSTLSWAFPDPERVTGNTAVHGVWIQFP